MTIRAKLRSFYNQLIPSKIPSRVSTLRHSNDRSHRVYKQDPQSYYAALIRVSNRISQNESLTLQMLDPLHKVFAVRQVRSHLLELDWWADFIVAATNFDEDSTEAQERLISHVHKLPLHTFHFWELLHLYSLAIRVGLFRVGYSLRCKAQKVAINSLKKGRKTSRYERIAGIAAQIEIGEYPEARQNILQLNDYFDREKDALCYLYRLVAPENEVKLMPKSKLELNISNQDKKFRDFVFGRAIALVCPAKSDQGDAKKIDSYDLVVRCNYREKGVGIDDKIKGLRCDITYFNDTQHNYFCSQETINWPDEVMWAVCKSKSRANKIEKKVKDYYGNSLYSELNVRSLKTEGEVIFFNKKLNLMPNIVLDLLRFEPKVIHVFHADLFVTVERAFGYNSPNMKVQDNSEQSVKMLTHFSEEEDPVTQYNILHRLWEQKKIGGDTRFSEVMSLGEKEYMRQLQTIYGHVGRVKTSIF